MKGGGVAGMAWYAVSCRGGAVLMLIIKSEMEW